MALATLVGLRPNPFLHTLLLMKSAITREEDASQGLTAHRHASNVTLHGGGLTGCGLAKHGLCSLRLTVATSINGDIASAMKNTQGSVNILGRSPNPVLVVLGGKTAQNNQTIFSKILDTLQK